MKIIWGRKKKNSKKKRKEPVCLPDMLVYSLNYSVKISVLRNNSLCVHCTVHVKGIKISALWESDIV